tara:strand:- start:346 stop:729 length:384 start_codon:yes stop_codon:yes gene_type:complete
MAGKIVADQLEHSSAGSLDTQYVVNGSAKNWLAFDGTATTPAARGSFNHSSITDNDTGDFTNNFTSSLADVNYAPMVLGSHDSSNYYTGLELVTIATGSVRFHTKYAANNTKYNMTDTICTIHGDLA